MKCLKNQKLGIGLSFLFTLAIVLPGSPAGAGTPSKETFSSVDEKNIPQADLPSADPQATADAKADPNRPVAGPTLDPPPGDSGAQATAISPEIQTRINELEARVKSLSQELAAVKKKNADADTVVAVQRHPIDDAAPVPDAEPKRKLHTDASVEKFRSARILFESGKTADAILAFTQWVNENPDHALAPAAQFMTGECYRIQKESKLAAIEYRRVLTNYPRSSYVPDALARLAESPQATSDRQQLLSLFPGSPAAKPFVVKQEIAKEAAPAEPHDPELPAAALPPAEPDRVQASIDPPPTATLPGGAAPATEPQTELPDSE